MALNARIGAFIVSCLVCLITSGAQAEGFDVRPVILEAKGGLATFTVANPGTARIYIETSVMEWSKDADGKDLLKESAEAVASPPGIWVPAGASYLVRVSLPPPRGNQERAFRVLAQQVPDRSSFTAGRIVFAVTQSLPAFSQPDSMAPPTLSATLRGTTLMITNSGGRRSRIQAVRQDGRTLATGLLGYALAGTTSAIPVPGLHAGHVDIDTDLGPRALEVR